MTLSLGFSAIDREVTEAARTMGANDARIASTIVLPMILPYLVSGFAFAFVLSLNEYIVAYMTVGFTQVTVPIKIFNALRYGYTPTMASISVLFVAVAVLVFGLVAWFGDLPKLLVPGRRAMKREGRAMKAGALQMDASVTDPAARQR